MDLHIGSEIKSVAKHKRIGTIELSKRIPMTRQNLDKIYRKKTIDTELLFLISKALNFNFFKLYQDAFEGKLQGSKHLLGQPDNGTGESTGDHKSQEQLLSEMEKERDYLAEKYRIQTENATNQQEYIQLLKEKLATLEKADSAEIKKLQDKIIYAEKKITSYEELEKIYKGQIKQLSAKLTVQTNK